MFETFHVLQPAVMLAASLLCGFAGAACVFKLLGAALVVAAGESLTSSPGGKPLRTWPRDRARIIASSLAFAFVGAACLGAAYVFAVRALNS